MKGWFREGYRHSLARKGIRTSFQAKEDEMYLQMGLQRALADREARERIIEEEKRQLVELEVKFEEWMRKITSQPNFTIHIKQGTLDVNKLDWHYQWAQTPEGVVLVGEFPDADGELVPGVLDPNQVVLFLEEYGQVVDDVE